MISYNLQYVRTNQIREKKGWIQRKEDKFAEQWASQNLTCTGIRASFSMKFDVVIYESICIHTYQCHKYLVIWYL